MFYELPQKWGQIVYFTGKELILLKKIVHKKEYEKSYGYEIINIENNFYLKKKTNE
jgi:hypothetical protein